MNKPRIRLPHLAWREVFLIALPALLLLLLAFWAAYTYVKPAPPDSLQLSSGVDVSPYGLWGEQFREKLALSGVTLRVRNSSGAAENLQRLCDPTQPTEVGFVQGGMGSDVAGVCGASKPGTPARGSAKATPKLVSLGSLAVEPLWVFYRGDQTLSQLREMAGKRIAIGGVGSGTYTLARKLLAMSGVTEANAQLLPHRLDEAPADLLAGRLDAVFISAPPDALPVRQLIAAPGVRLMHFEHAAAYARQLAYVSKLSLPRGSLDFARDFPDRDIDMVGTSVNLVVRDDVHPALMYLLLDTASQLHSEHGLFQTKAEYPSAKGQDIALADEAQRYYSQGKPFLQRYLPYWLANLVDRLMVLLIPLLAVLVPVVKLFPDIYDYRIRQRIAYWYRALRELEHHIQGSSLSDAESEALSSKLDGIEAGILADRIPAMNSDAFYSLRSAIDLIRDRLGRPDDKTLSVLRARRE